MSEKQKKLPRFVPGDVMGRICVLWRVIFGVLKRRVTCVRASSSSMMCVLVRVPFHLYSKRGCFVGNV